jgi:hypothetical protein
MVPMFGISFKKERKIFYFSLMLKPEPSNRRLLYVTEHLKDKPNSGKFAGIIELDCFFDIVEELGSHDQVRYSKQASEFLKKKEMQKLQKLIN